MVLKVDDGNFKQEVLEYEGLALIDISAEWCAPCKMLDPIVHSLNEEMGDKVKFCTVDIDGSKEIGRGYEIQAVPTLMLFKGGELLDRHAGLMPKPALKQWIESHM